MKIMTTFSHPLARFGLSACFTAALSGCIDFGDDHNRESEPVSMNLKLTQNEAELKQYLSARYLTQASTRPTYEYAEDASADEGAKKEAFSGTNTIVKGVDESDVWKYDGEHFFVVKPAEWEYGTSDFDCFEGRSLASADIMPPCSINPTKVSESSLRIVSRTGQQLVELELTGFDVDSLYLTEQQVWLLGRNDFTGDTSEGKSSYYGGQTAIKVLDITNKAQPKTIASISIDGSFVQTRRLGNELVFVSRFSPSISGLDGYPETAAAVAQNRRIIDSTPMSEWLPQIVMNDSTQNLVEANNCYIEQQPDGDWGPNNLVLITRFNMNTHEFDSRCIAGQVGSLYVSQSNVYLLNNTYWNYFDEMDLVSASGKTHIHKFSLNNEFNYLGSTVLPGMMAGNANFSVGELSDGRLGIVTNKGDWSKPDHLLTILGQQNGALATIATLPNAHKPDAIGKPGEQIYSVRFMQNRAYIVTFQKVDPLYVIDLSDSGNPAIAGELEIPGFSDYLHPVGNDLLIGVGKDAKLGNSGTTWFQGIKVALFDVSNMNDPKEVNHVILGKRGSHTALAYDHLAFAGLQTETSYRFAFPLSINEGEAHDQNRSDPESQYYTWSYTGLQLFEIKDGLLKNAGVMKTEVNDGSENYDRWNIRRGLIQGDDIYHLNGSDIVKGNWQNPDAVSSKF